MIATANTSDAAPQRDILSIFLKYTQGFASSSLPFKLYEEEPVSNKVIKKLKKRNSRGPYRKYSAQEKRMIIHRVTLKLFRSLQERP